MFDNKPIFHAPSHLWVKLQFLARQMRHKPTPAEDEFWQRVRNRRVVGAKFRRQYAIERFIVDFICLEFKLIIEIDGEIHTQQREYDTIRQEFLESQEFRVLRFTNEAVLTSLDEVVEAISAYISSVKVNPLP